MAVVTKSKYRLTTDLIVSNSKCNDLKEVGPFLCANGIYFNLYYSYIPFSQQSIKNYNTEEEAKTNKQTSNP